MPARLLKGNLAAKSIILKLKELSIKLQTDFKIPKENLPKIALIDCCLDFESKLYIKKKKSIINDIGFSYHEFIFQEYKKNELINLIKFLNSERNIHGILIQLPIPLKEDTEELLEYIDPDKDIDGLTNINMSKIKTNDMSGIKSCAALGILNLLKAAEINFKSSRFVLVGNGKLINYPLGLLLKHSYFSKNIDVVDISTENSESIIEKGDVIISATGVKYRIKADFVKKGAVVIDCGSIHKKETEFEKLLEVASYITPIPGGVGPLTISYLMVNVMKAFCLQNKILFSEEEIKFLKSYSQ